MPGWCRPRKKARLDHTANCDRSGKGWRKRNVNIVEHVKWDHFYDIQASNPPYVCRSDIGICARNKYTVIQLVLTIQRFRHLGLATACFVEWSQACMLPTSRKDRYYSRSEMCFQRCLRPQQESQQGHSVPMWRMRPCSGRLH
jgi:hypothetical protein